MNSQPYIYLGMFIKDTKNTVVNTVRETRTGLKLTQDELASKVHVTRQTIIAIEKGNYVPSVLLALKIAAILDVKVEEIFRYEKI
jgi:putative transcriptional regulator